MRNPKEIKAALDLYDSHAITPDEIKHLTTIRSLTPEQWKELKDFAQYLKERKDNAISR